MNLNNLCIRREIPEDYFTVENLVREAFWNVYRPGCMEHYVLHVLRKDPAFIPELDLILEKDGQCIGQVLYMHSSIQSDDGRKIPVLTFGPISIHPDFQLRGYGKLLLDTSLDLAGKMGAGALCIEGNIDFYGKSGFVVAGEKGIRYHGEPASKMVPYFLVKELISDYLKGVTGVYHTPQGYFVKEIDVEKFDQKFPPKKKLKLASQIF